MWKQIGTFGVNAVIVIALGIAWDLVKQKEPPLTGFFCHDATLTKPYVSARLSKQLLYGLGYSIPLLLAFLAELCLEVQPYSDSIKVKNGNGDKEWQWRVSLHGRTIPTVLYNTLMTYLNFLLGAFSVILITYVSKVTCGRLRPNFFTVCNLTWSEINCTEDTRPLYITDYHCNGNSTIFDEEDMERELKDQRKSFMSGHSSYAFSAATWCILYLQAKVHPLISKTFIVAAIQISFFCLAFAAAVSRAIDFKHHWDDVLMGSVMGMAIQAFNVVFVLGAFKRRPLATSEMIAETKRLPTVDLDRGITNTVSQL